MRKRDTQENPGPTSTLILILHILDTEDNVHFLQFFKYIQGFLHHEQTIPGSCATNLSRLLSSNSIVFNHNLLTVLLLPGIAASIGGVSVDLSPPSQKSRKDQSTDFIGAILGYLGICQS